MKQILTVVLTLMVFSCFAQENDHSKPKQRPIAANLNPSEKSVAELYKRVLPAVVTVFTQSNKISERGTSQQNGLGSGVLISNQCHILTAAHVVKGSTQIMVRTQDGILRKASVLFSQSSADIALLKLAVKDSTLSHAIMGNSDDLSVGQNVYAIGSPYGMENSFSSGIISAFRGFDKIYDGSVGIEFLQTDAAINSGNSGGPLFNSRGEIIGIASGILTVSGGFQGIGMAVTINTAKDILSFENRPWIGIDGILLQQDEFAKVFNSELSGGILVQSVALGSPAEKVGLKGGFIPADIAGRKLVLGGDIILSINNHTTCHVHCLEKLRPEMANKNTTIVEYLRNGKINSVSIDVSEHWKNFLETE